MRLRKEERERSAQARASVWKGLREKAKKKKKVLKPSKINYSRIGESFMSGGERSAQDTLLSQTQDSSVQDENVDANRCSKCACRDNEGVYLDKASLI